MTDRQETRRSYDVVAGNYTAEIFDELRHKPFDRGLLDAFAELVADGTVADVGCGPGHVAADLADRGVRVFGVDLSPGMCATAGKAASLRTCAADMTALPLCSQALRGLVCMYAVIHLDTVERAAAYQEFARVLGDGGLALIAFHTSDPETPTGGHRRVREWWGHDVDVTFHFLEAGTEARALGDAGLQLVARLDRSPHPGLEHASRRSYLVVKRE